MPTHPDLITGASGYEDAGVFRLNETTALIQTLDFFTPMVDDPFMFGRIAAANALSDVYAMGGTPLLAMNIVEFPIKDLDKNILKEILAGGLEKIKEAGALLVGGHSVEDQEMKYGLSVTGTVHPDRVVMNSGARPGDLVLLTKPIGTGIISTAIKGGVAKDCHEQTVSICMATLNRLAGEIMAETGVHCATDITGFGLAGHLREIALASGVDIDVKFSEIPVLDGCLDFCSMGMIPEGAYLNRKFYSKWVDINFPEDRPELIVLYDPQTSGGLLITAPEDKIKTIINKLEGETYSQPYKVIGSVKSPEGKGGKLYLS